VLVFRNMDQSRYTPAHGKVSVRVDNAEGWARLLGLLGLHALPLSEVVRAWAAINGHPLPRGDLKASSGRSASGWAFPTGQQRDGGPARGHATVPGHP